METENGRYLYYLRSLNKPPEAKNVHYTRLGASSSHLCMLHDLCFYPIADVGPIPIFVGKLFMPTVMKSREWRTPHSRDPDILIVKHCG